MADTMAPPGMPARLYDAHAHLIAQDVSRYPHNPIPRDPSQPSPFGPGMVGRPGGMHGPNPVNEKPTAEQMDLWMTQEHVVGMASVQKARIYSTDNCYILDAADLFPDRMRAVVVVDPQSPQTPQMVRDYAGRGIAAIRFFGAGVKDKKAWLSSPQSLSVWGLAAELGLPVDIEAPPVGGDALIPVVVVLVVRFPKLAIVLDHVFTPDVMQPDFGIGASFEGFAARKNISVKFTSINMDVSREKGRPPEEVLRRTVDFFGADRVMWGSDIGTSSGTYKEMVHRAVAATALLNEVERRKVLHDTGRRFFTAWRDDTTAA